MRTPNPSKAYHPAGILFCGLLMAQVLAVIQVYLSNLNLHAAVSTIQDAGYLAIPNQRVMPNLRDFWPAFWGGVFFTCSIGAGVTLGSMAAGWFWLRLFGRHKFALFIILSVWGGLLLILNIHGFALLATLYFLIIPPVIFFLTARWLTLKATRDAVRLGWLNLIPIPLLALLWFTQYDAAMFLDLRDNLLLSNSAGKKFSQFYYDYTLYAAEAFKSLDQKLIKTCRLEDIADHQLRPKMVRRLLAADYLTLPGTARVDLRIIQKDDSLVFMRGDKKILVVRVNQFLSDPRKVLQRYSAARDRHGAFRQFTYLSLLMGFPVMLYLILHFAIYYPIARFIRPKYAAAAASLLCLLIGLTVLVYFQSNRSGRIRVTSIPEALTSDRLSTRLAALKRIGQEELEITDYPAYSVLLSSPHPQERYWLAAAMATSRRPESFNALLQLLDDESTNVRTMALYSLGRRNNRQAIKPILQKIRTSEDWYAQLYAYNALKALGWKQTKLH